MRRGTLSEAAAENDAVQIDDMRELLKSGVLSINARGLWKQFLFAL